MPRRALTRWLFNCYYGLKLFPFRNERRESLARGQKKGLKVGFFLHTPFCTSEIFRVLPDRGELLKGVLGADVIGFHTYNYLRHFRSSLLHVLGIESEMDTVLGVDRAVKLGVYPIGHDHLGFTQAMRSDEFRRCLDEHAKELAGKKLLLSVERLDYTKGVPQKLRAIRRFLDLTGQGRTAFDERLAVIGALNALRIAGVFSRLQHRDGKRRYADFQPRQLQLLARNLSHPALRGMAAFVRKTTPFVFEGKV